MDRNRGYQEGFYALHGSVRDARSRVQKAEKMLRVLERHTTAPLASAACLDVGCSSGLTAAALAPRCRVTFGIEYDVLALNAAMPATRAAVHFARGDAMALPFRNGSVDIIICAQVYEHVPDDERLAREIHRVLAPGGVVFFSGPNWLFPVELHYGLPFVHWLPARWADRWLRLAGRGQHYYERSRHLWGLRRLFSEFVIQDVSLEVLRDVHLAGRSPFARIGRLMPWCVWRLLVPFFPNFNWLLWKPAGESAGVARLPVGGR